MGISVGGKGGVTAEMNVVPLIDILLVLLVIFMIIKPQDSVGMDAKVPQPAPAAVQQKPDPEIVVVQVLADGSLKINQQPVSWDGLGGELAKVFSVRSQRTAFIRGDDVVEFELVARAIDTMRGAGVVSVGLLTPELEKNQSKR